MNQELQSFTQTWIKLFATYDFKFEKIVLIVKIIIVKGHFQFYTLAEIILDQKSKEKIQAT